MPMILTPTAEDKRLPASEESERAVLAAILLDSYTLPTISGRLEVDDFFSDRHREIYRAMLDLKEADEAIDLRTVQAKLEQRAKLEEVGGISYLVELDLDLPDLGRVESYIEIVKERAVRRRLIQTSHEIIRDCLDGGVEARVALSRAEAAVLLLGEAIVRRGFVPLGNFLPEVVSELEERPGSTLIGVPTGFIDLDRMTQGLHPGNLVIVAGRPGMGKTSFALNIAQNVAIREGRCVGIFSLEMGKEELALRILCSEADFPFSRLRSGNLSTNQWTKIFQVTRSISEAPLYIDDSPNPTLLEISSRGRRLKSEKGLTLLIVDYLQLMQSGAKFENRNLEIAAMTRGLKQLAKELEIPVIALSQLSRQPERRGSDHRPQLADLRESGAIEQDADLVSFIYRDEVYNPTDENKGLAEVIIAKHRNGETGTVPLVFLGESTSFRNLDRHGGGPSVPPPF